MRSTACDCPDESGDDAAGSGSDGEDGDEELSEVNISTGTQQ